MPTIPHDGLFKAAFAQPDLARGELELLLPAEVKRHLDLTSLRVVPGSFLDDELKSTHADLLYTVRAGEGGAGEAFVYVLFEHQSSFDATMPLRLLRYLVRVWERWLREHEGAGKLPLVLPVVLHHSESGWRAAPELASMLDADPSLLEATRPFVPHFRFLLDDLSDKSAEELASRALHALARLVQMALWSSRSWSRLEQAAPLMAAVASTLARDARARELLLQLYVYLWQAAPQEVAAERVRGILLQVAGPQGAEDVMNAAEELIARGEAKGRAQGLRDAIQSVLESRGMPLSQLGQARLTSCTDVAELTTWLQRAVTASSEARVFAGTDET